jgi:hypothetical protein
MPGSADAIQKAIHALEAGGAAIWMRRALASVLIMGLALLLFVLCGWPMVFNLFFASAKGGVRWPSYVPPYIAVIHDWMKPDEITATDKAWAVAWYADRRADCLPGRRSSGSTTSASFFRDYDWQKMSARQF